MCICQLKNFPALIRYTPNPRFKGKGRKAKGAVGLKGKEGREWERRNDEGGKVKERKGRKRVKTGAPKLKFWRRHQE
jgi:hypothetical protein